MEVQGSARSSRNDRGGVTLAAEAAHPLAPGEADAGHEDAGGEGEQQAESKLSWAGLRGKPGVAGPRRCGWNEVRQIVGCEKPVARGGGDQEVCKGPLNGQETRERGCAENGGLRPAVERGDVAPDDIEDDSGNDQEKWEIRRDEVRDFLIDRAELGLRGHQLQNPRRRNASAYRSPS